MALSLMVIPRPRSLQLALLSSLMIIFSYLSVFSSSHGWSDIEMSTLTYYLLGSISLSAYSGPRTLHLWRLTYFFSRNYRYQKGQTQGYQ